MAARTILFPLVLLAALTSCHSKRMFQDRRKITVADAQQVGYSLIYIAEAQGFFSDEGLDVEFRKFNIGKDALSDVLSGNSDIATVYSSPVIFQTLAGRDVNVLGTLHRSAHNTAIFARTDRGIRTLDDLAGKKIGLTLGTSSEYFLDLMLTAEGFDPKSLQNVDIKVEDLIAALEQGKVDAIVAWGALLPQARKLFPDRQSAIFFSEIYSETSVLAASPQFLAQHGSETERFVKALVRAEAYQATHAGESASIIKKRLQALNPDDVQATLDVSQLLIRADNALLYGMNDEAIWIARMQASKETPPRFESRIRPVYLERSQPLFVTLPDSK